MNKLNHTNQKKIHNSMISVFVQDNFHNWKYQTSKSWKKGTNLLHRNVQFTMNMQKELNSLYRCMKGQNKVNDYTNCCTLFSLFFVIIYTPQTEEQVFLNITDISFFFTNHFIFTLHFLQTYQTTVQTVSSLFYSFNRQPDFALVAD